MATAREQVFVAQPISYAGQRVIASPFQFATTEDDNLQIVSANSLAGVVLAVQGRQLTAAGNIEPFAFVHVPNSDRSTKTENYKLGAGALLNLTIYASSGTPTIGQTYVSARIIRGLASVTIIVGALLGGYVTGAQALAYPGSPIISSIEGGGYIRNITGTTPAVGAQISETVPAGARWELLSLFSVLSVAGGGVNNIPQLLALTATLAAKTFSQSSQLQAPGTGVFWVWASWGTVVVGASNAIALPWPPGLGLLAGERITTTSTGFTVNDQWGAPIYTVREWLEVQS